jgi:6-phosphogluconolactonase
MESSDILVFDTREQLALAAAERFVECEYAFRGELERFTVALAGGNTPRRVYELLGTERFKNRVHWSQVHLFFGDERAVPADHPDSNYAMAYEALISKVPIPAKNVRRMIGEGDARENARLYENQLRTFFAAADWPQFDFVFLGLGEDGHTASLFPRSAALAEKSKWVSATKQERTGQVRLTLTVPVFNHAGQVVFLVSGKRKAKILAEVLHSQPGSDSFPAQAIQPISGELCWMVDKSAASLL